ncbi:MAG: hypothetical protein GF384_08205 [Elusimicrobia bacterium]|nr:hypothetical protein [Elusimicrobiota bacterium]
MNIIISDNPIKLGIYKMKYLDLIKELRKRKYFIFSLNDLYILFPGINKKTLQNQLTEWGLKRYIVRLKRDLYELAEKDSRDNIIPDIAIAQRLYFPSYVSCETALSIYALIPETAFGVTSVTTKPTRTFKNIHGLFMYYSCQPRVYTGYYVKEYSGYTVALAEKEKALVDFIYFRFRGKKPEFKSLRFDRDQFCSLRWKKVSGYSKLYNQHIVHITQELKEYLQC